MRPRLPALFCALLCPAAGVRAAPGDVEGAFNALVSGTSGSSVYSAVPQADGRILVGGWFTSVSSVTRNNLARLIPSPSLDPAFSTGTNDPSSAAVRSLAVLADGRIVVAGEFRTLGDTPRGRIGLVGANGALDASFNPDANNFVYSSAVQPDGKILIGGTFTTVGGQSRNRIARLHPDGTLDTAFNPDPNNNVRIILVQDDGKILIGGNFTTVGISPRNRLARLHEDGTLDTAFNPNIEGTVYSATLLNDGRIIAGGTFLTAGGMPRLNIVRLTPAGLIDDTFNTTANENVRCMALQTDGKMIIGGDFTAIGGISRSRLARLNADGSLDTAFTAGANGSVYGLALQKDGKVIVGGGYTTFGGLSRRDLVRLDNNTATQSLTVPTPNKIQWLRGGASPEVRPVTFEVSANNGNSWAALGPASRIPGGWAYTGTLPAAGQIRARARIHCGYGNASSTVEETTAAYTYTGLQAWRYSHFATLEETGAAANSADPDRDGLENLVEFAFHLNPNTPDAAALPRWERDDDYFVMSVTTPPVATGISYIPEYSTSMSPGSWQPGITAGTAPDYVFAVPATAPRLYLRVRITAP